MDETLEQKLARVADLIGDATLRVSNLLDEEKPALADLDVAHEKVAAATTAYREVLESVPVEQRDPIERAQGRRALDLRRLAAQLPQRAGGQAVARAADAAASGGHPFLLRRDPPKSIQPGRDELRVRRGEEDLHHVGGTVEAWCGPCGGVTDHTIAALVGGQPKHVVCGTCGSKHGFRTEPARKGPKGPAGPAKLTPEQVESKKAEEARFALIKELTSVENPRPFRTGERYKAGEIIQHPEHGRGKIETVIRGAIIVRFRDGVKSLMNM
ncbi:MAG: hypothetical protein HY906_20275 [Deltaproteobacteria bacterium]|nr:hypothetical protein [Deltaproteobacteria bacterium]